MLRESSVPYSSLPQEEGDQTYITTRPGEPKRLSKARLVTIMILLLILLGVPLLVIAPLAISRGWQFPKYGIPHTGDQKSPDTSNSPIVITNAGTSAPPHPETFLPPIRITTSTANVPSTTAKKPTTATSTTTTTTTTTTTATTTTPAPSTTTTTTTTTPATTTKLTPKPTIPAPITKPAIPPATVNLKPTVETAVGGVGKNQTGNTTDIKITDSQKGSANGSGSGIPGGNSNAGSYSFTNTQKISNMMNKFMSKHEWWTVVSLAVVAALALAAVITMIAWIIKSCLTSRRRKTDLHKVITDLQSKDKVVLLNSEDSEEEP